MQELPGTSGWHPLRLQHQQRNPQTSGQEGSEFVPRHPGLQQECGCHPGGSQVCLPAICQSRCSPTPPHRLAVCLLQAGGLGIESPEAGIKAEQWHSVSNDGEMAGISINTHHFLIMTIDPYFNPMLRAMQAQLPSPHFQPDGLP